MYNVFAAARERVLVSIKRETKREIKTFLVIAKVFISKSFYFI